MPLPNGVDPTGSIHSTCPSATFLGNRGILHRPDGVISKPWQHKAWVACAMSFNGRNRKPLMQANRYSELFFLDEVTALAAGHRPCGECRNADYKRFKMAWLAANATDGRTLSIAEIDKMLHAERATPTKEKNTFTSTLKELPSGAIFKFGEQMYLYWHGQPLLWSPQGYALSHDAIGENQPVIVLTPPSIVNMLALGYEVQVHESVMRPQS